MLVIFTPAKRVFCEFIEKLARFLMIFDRQWSARNCVGMNKQDYLRNNVISINVSCPCTTFTAAVINQIVGVLKLRPKKQSLCIKTTKSSTV